MWFWHWPRFRFENTDAETLGYMYTKELGWKLENRLKSFAQEISIEHVFVCSVVLVRRVLDFQALNLVIEYIDTSNQNESESCSVVSDCLWPYGLYSSWNSPGQNTGVGSLSLLQPFFLTQEWNQGFQLCKRILYQLSYQGSPVTKIRSQKKKKKKEICFKRIIMLQLICPWDVLLMWKLFTVLKYGPPEKVSGMSLQWYTVALFTGSTKGLFCYPG